MTGTDEVSAIVAVAATLGTTILGIGLAKLRAEYVAVRQERAEVRNMLKLLRLAKEKRDAKTHAG